MAGGDVEVRIHGKDELSSTLRTIGGKLGTFANAAKVALGVFTAQKILKWGKDALRASIDADSGMKAAASSITTNFQKMQVSVGTALLGNKGIVTAINSLLTAATPVVGFLSGLLGKAFVGLEMIVIDLVAQFKKVPYALEDIGGEAKILWGNIEEIAGKGGRLFGRVFGIKDLGAGTIQSGQDLQTEGRAQRAHAGAAQQVLQTEADAKRNQLARDLRTGLATGIKPPETGKTGKTDKTDAGPDKVTIEKQHFQDSTLSALGFDQQTIDDAISSQMDDQERAQRDNAKSFLQPLDLKRSMDLVPAVQPATKAVSELSQTLKDLKDNSVAGLGGAFADAFYAAASGADSLGAATVKSVKAMVGQIAKMEGELQFAKGVEKLAEGTWPPNPLALKSAGLHFAAGALFMTLAGALGGGGGGGGGGGAGGIGGQGGQRDQKALSQGADATIVLDYIDIDNPQREERLRRDLERLSGKRIRITRSSGRV